MIRRFRSEKPFAAVRIAAVRTAVGKPPRPIDRSPDKAHYRLEVWVQGRPVRESPARSTPPSTPRSSAVRRSSVEEGSSRGSTTCSCARAGFPPTRPDSQNHTRAQRRRPRASARRAGTPMRAVRCKEDSHGGCHKCPCDACCGGGGAHRSRHDGACADTAAQVAAGETGPFRPTSWGGCHEVFRASVGRAGVLRIRSV